MGPRTGWLPRVFSSTTRWIPNAGAYDVLELGKCRDLLMRSLDQLLPSRGGPPPQRSPHHLDGGEAMVKPRGEAGACSRASLTLGMARRLPAHTPFLSVPLRRLSFCSLWFGMCSCLLSHTFFLPHFMATAARPFSQPRSLCRSLSTEARGAVAACLALRSGSFQSGGSPWARLSCF